jgi:hypothetical protein
MNMSQPKPKRPAGVTIIAIIAAAGGVFSLFGGAMVVSGMANGPLALAYIVIVFGILGLLLGSGFFTGAKWAWLAGIVIYILSIGLGFAEIFYGGSVGFLGGMVRVIAGIVFPFYLSRKGPKSFFGRAGITATPQATTP